jgi:CCR4-NOT transcription complex subunit 9
MMNHMYGHNQYNPQADGAWLHQQPNHHQHAQQQAAAAAASAAQQQHYSRIASSHGASAVMSSAMSQLSGLHSQEGSLENVSEDNRRTLAYIADLLNENTREAALLELSKKREQVPELALILWHSFGTL